MYACKVRSLHSMISSEEHREAVYLTLHKADPHKCETLLSKPWSLQSSCLTRSTAHARSSEVYPEPHLVSSSSILWVLSVTMQLDASPPTFAQ